MWETVLSFEKYSPCSKGCPIGKEVETCIANVPPLSTDAIAMIVTLQQRVSGW